MDQDIYQEVSRKIQKISKEEACVKRYRATIEQIETWFFQGGKPHEMNVTKINTKPNIKEAC